VREVYERIFNGVVKRLGMNTCAEAVEFLYERYYTNGVAHAPAIAGIFWRSCSRFADFVNNLSS